MKLSWKRIWKVLGDLSLIHWLITAVPTPLPIYAWLVGRGYEKIIVLSLLALALSVLILVLIVIRQLKISRTVSGPLSEPRVGIKATNSRVTIDGGTIENQTVGIDATDSDIKQKDLQIK